MWILRGNHREQLNMNKNLAYLDLFYEKIELKLNIIDWFRSIILKIWIQ